MAIVSQVGLSLALLDALRASVCLRVSVVLFLFPVLLAAWKSVFSPVATMRFAMLRGVNGSRAIAGLITECPLTEP